MRISYDLGNTKLTSKITSREVLLVPNLFSDFQNGEIYKLLLNEMDTCDIPKDQLLKIWHGDSHFIVDDHLDWKSKCPTFSLVIDRIRNFFNMDIKATRLNIYTEAQWKPFHHDAAAVKPNKMNTQNFTVGVSFGCTREAAFENAHTKTVISIPQNDGSIYAFAKDTNIIWRHGILQEKEHPENIGRISIIAWGWIDNQIQLN